MGGYFAYEHWFVDSLPEGLVQVNGRIEGDHITVASKYPGRVREVLVREGDNVREGQILVRLDDTETQARVDQARYGAVALEAQLRGAVIELALLKKEIPINIDEAKTRVTEAQARRTAATATEKNARRDAERYKALAKKDISSKRIAEKMDTAWVQARDALVVAIAGETLAKHTLDHANLSWDRVEAKEQQVAALAAQLEQARAALLEVASILASLNITSPVLGTVTTSLADIGEIVEAGVPMFDVVNLDRLYLKAYVPVIEIGKIRLSLKAQVFTDAFPDQPFPATVLYIASQADFTPREVQTPDERIKLVYAIKLYLDKIWNIA